ncbi:MAG: ZIP family metal transporter, partial [Gemmatimonadota bacterium]
MSDVTLVFLFALATAVATGLGAIPFLFVRTVSDRGVAYSNAVAAGLMLGASFGLVAEGTDHGRIETILGGLLGVLFILGTQRFLGERNEKDLVFEAAEGDDGRKMLLMMIVMTVHS